MRRVTPRKTISELAREAKPEPQRLIRGLRRDARLTMREVAQHAGVSAATVSRAENGKGVDVRTALRLARFYETTVEALWGDLA